MKEVIFAKNAPRPVGPYSQAVKVGNFLFISGQLAIDPKQGKILADSIRQQTIQVMENITAILQSADYNITDIVQTYVYLRSMTLSPEFNDEYAKYFQNQKDYPARVTVAVELPLNALVEISAIAYKQ